MSNFFASFGPHRPVGALDVTEMFPDGLVGDLFHLSPVLDHDVVIPDQLVKWVALSKALELPAPIFPINEEGKTVIDLVRLQPPHGCWSGW